jgi:hypothetical protein
MFGKRRLNRPKTKITMYKLYTGVGLFLVGLGVCGTLTGCKCFETSSDKSKSPAAKTGFFTQPEDQVVKKGGTAIFAIVPQDADNQNRYQWFKNEQAIPLANNSSLVISDAKMSDVGVYTVAIERGGKKQSSEPAMLYFASETNTTSGSIIIGGGVLGLCPGSFTCRAKFKDPATASIQFTPPPSATSCTLSIVGGPTGKVEIKNISTLQACCNDTSVTCSIISTNKYWFTAYYPSAACGQTATVTWTWLP